jgi:hypothetical protein
VPLARRVGPILASLGISIVLWLIVRNLDRTPARFTIPVAYEYPEKDVVLVERVPEVEIAVNATKPKLRTLQAAEFVVKIRNPEGRRGREFVVLDTDDVEAPFGVDVERVTPAQFVVRYEERAVRPARVAPDVQGRPANGHVVDTGGIRARPAEVMVAGPASQFEASLVVHTERIDVSGRSQPLKARAVTLIPPGPGFSFDGVSSVEVDVPVVPVISRRTFEDVPIEVIEGERTTATPNPRRLRVTVEGPQLALESLTQRALSATVDASSLEPRGQDYQLEPKITLADGACPGCRVVGRSQARIDVSVRKSRTPR